MTRQDVSGESFISVTVAELSVCDVLSLSPEVLLGSAVFTPSSVYGTWWVRCMLGVFVPAAYG